MSYPNPYADDRQNNGETAAQTRLVVMLYDGALRFLGQAIPAMQSNNVATRTRYIGKAHAILGQLRANLEFAADGPSAQTLNDFYVKAHDTLSDANIHDKVDGVVAVIEGLRELRDAWIEVDRQSRACRPTRLAVATQARFDAIAA